MWKNDFVIIDTETGGLDKNKHSLLTIALFIVKNWRIVAKKEWKIKHEQYNCCEEALKINGINLDEHDRTALQGNIVANEIIDFLSEYYSMEEKALLVGQNTIFDIGFLETFLASLPDDSALKRYKNLVGHRYVDLISITAFLNMTGLFNTESLKLDALIKHFGIETKARHTAFDDCMVTYQVLLRMVKLVKFRNSNEYGQLD